MIKQACSVEFPPKDRCSSGYCYTFGRLDGEKLQHAFARGGGSIRGKLTIDSDHRAEALSQLHAGARENGWEIAAGQPS